MRNQGIGSKPGVRSILVVGATVLCCGVSLASIPDSNGIFHACYDNKTGVARIIDAATASCTSKETAASWSMIGPIGPPGRRVRPGLKARQVRAVRRGSSDRRARRETKGIPVRQGRGPGSSMPTGS